MIDFIQNISFTNYAWGICLPFLLMTIDMITGLANSFVKKNFQSSKMRSGLGKKIGELSILIIGYVVDFAIDIPSYIIYAISIYIAFMEFMSILENAKKLSVPIPKSIEDILNNVDESVNNRHITDDEIKRIIEELRKGDK